MIGKYPGTKINEYLLRENSSNDCSFDGVALISNSHISAYLREYYKAAIKLCLMKCVNIQKMYSLAKLGKLNIIG